MQRILELFINHPEKEFHVRQIAKNLNKSPTTISKYLKEYEKKGILKSEKKLNHLIFKANIQNKNFKQIKLNYNLSLLNNSGLIGYLEKHFNYPQAIVLFGSFAKSENLAKSDIDLLIVSPKKTGPPQKELKKYGEKLGHELQLFIHTTQEIKKLKQTSKELVNSWINGIVIYGYFEILK